MNATLHSPTHTPARATGFFALFGLIGLGAMKLWNLTHRLPSYHAAAPLPAKPAIDSKRAVCSDGCGIMPRCGPMA